MSTWLLVGLGNPGPTYASHRHNVGYRVVDELARRAGVRFTGAAQLRAEVAQTRLTASGMGGVGAEAEKVVLLKSRTYMNESGGPVKAAMDFTKADHLVVVHDELDIPLGSLRVKFGGGDNGHNGLRSIRKALGSGDFYRVRVGIGRPPGRQDPAEYVLKGFPSAERSELPEVVDRAADAVESLAAVGLDLTQNRFND